MKPKRVLQPVEIAAIHGSGEFGCDFASLSELADLAGAAAAIGSTYAVVVEGTSAAAGAYAFIMVGVAVLGMVGYNIGTGISNAVGFCDRQRDGGS